MAPAWDRHLDPGLFLKLDEACRKLTGLDRYYVPLAVFLMVEAGLAIEDLCALRWEGVSLDTRRMDVPKPLWPGGHEARTIVLSARARMYLEDAALALKEDDRFDPFDAVIPMTPFSLHRAFEDIVRLAEIELGELLYQALRTEAEARFIEAGLTRIERRIMLGTAIRILPGTQLDLISIQDKLDRHLFDGRTFNEAKDFIPVLPGESIVDCRKQLAECGLLKIESASPTVIRHFPNIALSILAA
jgi:integrase